MRITITGVVAVVSLISICATGHAQPPAQPPADEVVVPSDDDFGGPVVSDSGVGYIDNAILGDQLRFRYDATYDADQPARAEFFWPVDGPFGPGPGPETRVDYQDLSVYVEHQFAPRWSAFGELPVRFLNPEIQDNTAGLGDMNVGFKHALCTSCDSVSTFQFRAYLPSADGTRGLGTRHVSLEPSWLFYHRHTDRLSLQGEVRDWISVGGSDGFAGNVLRYGIGENYLLNPCGCHPAWAVVEFVGWTVLDGGTAITTPPRTLFTDATGDTIVNAKAGIRFQLNCCDSLYAGYGRALTEDVWYENVFRFEFRRTF